MSGANPTAPKSGSRIACEWHPDRFAVYAVPDVVVAALASDEPFGRILVTRGQTYYCDECRDEHEAKLQARRDAALRQLIEREEGGRHRGSEREG